MKTSPRNRRPATHWVSSGTVNHATFPLILHTESFNPDIMSNQAMLDRTVHHVSGETANQETRERLKKKSRCSSESSSITDHPIDILFVLALTVTEDDNRSMRDWNSTNRNRYSSRILSSTICRPASPVNLKKLKQKSSQSTHPRLEAR